MFRLTERGRGLVAGGRVAVMLAMMGLWGLPSLAQDRVVRPGGEAETAVLPYPFVVRLRIEETQAHTTATSIRTYSDGKVTANNVDRPNEFYCRFAKMTPQGAWPCGTVRTGSSVEVRVNGPINGVERHHSCRIQVPDKALAATRLVLTVTVGRVTPARCSWW